MDIKEITENLSKPLPIDSIDWRVQSVKKTQSGVGMIVLGYKDARVDMKRLDEATGGMWQNEYKRDSKGVLQCGIGVFSPSLELWVWKWSNGVESFSEAAKGEYSDSFKRAGFMWGIGRELYDLPFIWINLNEGEYFEASGKVKNKLNPNDLVWSKEGGLLQAVDKFGEVRFKERGGQSTQAKTNTPPSEPKKEGKPKLTKERFDKMKVALEADSKKHTANVKKTLNAVAATKNQLEQLEKLMS